MLFGPSAVGKTTTLRAVSGLVRPDSGIDPHRRRGTSPTPRSRAAGFRWCSSRFALYPHLTVFKNLAYPLIEDGVSSRGDRPAGSARPRRCSSSRIGLSRSRRRCPGGEQQRVALGRSLIHTPKLLLLDEPLTNLDAKLRHDMRAELKRLHRQFGMTVVYATPDELEALSMGEEIAVLRARPRRSAGLAGRSLRKAGRPLRRQQDRLAAHEHLRRQSRRRRRKPRDALRPIEPVAPR